MAARTAGNQNKAGDDVDPKDYGFRNITDDIADAPEPAESNELGPQEPVKVPAVSSGSTFAERAKARGGDKAVQAGENK